MSRFRLLTVGRPRDKRMEDLVLEYLKRLSAELSFEWQTVPEYPSRGGDEARAIQEEERQLIRRIHDRDLVVLLDVRGEMVDSPGLADKFQGWRDSGQPVVFVVGGSFGLGDGLRRRAAWRWSLSPLTLPHGLSQVVAAEQLYRAWMILKGHPYHK
jgi:23S rRNA (pseudouridine1915-N3)-methyltransferase